MPNKIILYLMIIVAFFAACSPARHIPKDNYLLNKVRISSDIPNQKGSELTQYLKQHPNLRTLGLLRVRLDIYNISGKDTSKWINRMFRNAGEPPVVYDEELTKLSQSELKRHLTNKGYVNAAIDYDVTYKRRKANVHYTVVGNKPYRIRNVTYGIRNDTILSTIKSDSLHSLLRSNMLFDMDILDAERQRIAKLLRQNGYYNLNKDHISYIADSTLHTNQVDIRLIVRAATKLESDGSIVRIPQKQYYVGNIRFYTAYDPLSSGGNIALDSIIEDDYIIYYNEKVNLRPDILIDNCHIDRNTLYDERGVERTYSAMNVLSAVRYVNIRFREVREGSDTLNCYILISPIKQQAYSIDLEGTNSVGDFGFATALGYQHKNLFKGSELFQLSFRWAHESMTESLSDLLYDSSNEYSAETSINFPKFLFPFLGDNFRKSLRANTEFKLGYSYQVRPEYSRTIASAGMRYLWSQNNGIKQHIFSLIDINYVYLPYVSDKFRENYLQGNSILKYSYENQLIAASSYSIRFSNVAANHLHNNINARIGVEAAGNMLYGLANMFNLDKEDGSYTIGGTKFSEYLKFDFDFAYDQYIDRRNNLVYHFGLGIAIPFGNLDVMPFEKRYIAGGANSVRGWSVRSLGPGTYRSPAGQNDYMNQSGDIKLDLNLEYRFKMFWIMQGALFFDAGNIWTIRSYNTQEGGWFKFDEFYKQIALGSGLGLRFDFSYFLFRLDLGMKMFNPVKEENKSQWRFKQLNLTDDFVLHFAVGYPF